MSRSDKIALCLAGGGITGSMFEIGCLKALDDFFDDAFRINDIDIYVGVSAGAIVSAFIANGYTPKQLFDGILENQSSPLNFKRKDIYNLPLASFFRSILPVFLRLPGLLRYGWVNRRHASLMDLVSIIQEFIPAGVFSLNNLNKFVAAVLYPEGKTNDFRNLDKELYIPAIDLDSGKRQVFGEDDDTVPISKAVAASAAIPVFFRPFRIDGHDYIDGSTGQVAHLDVAIRNGARLLIIVNPTVPIENDQSKNCLPTFDGACGRLAEKGMGFINDQARRIETRTRFKFELERFRNEHPDIDYVVIQPQASDGFLFLHGVMEYDSRKSILNYGYYTTISEMRVNLAKYAETFAKYKIKVRDQVDQVRV